MIAILTKRMVLLRVRALARRNNRYFYILTFLFSLFTSNFSFAQQTYNLEVVFKRTNWNPDSIRSYGNALSTAGDINQDGFDDIVYSVFFGNWYGYGYVYFGGNPMDTFPDLVLKGEGEGQPLMSICAGDLNGDGVSEALHQKVVYEYNHLNSFVNGKIC